MMLVYCASADHDDDHGGAAGGHSTGTGPGMGSELRRPLGIAMVGGLLLSQVLTLYTTRLFISSSIGSAIA